MYTCWLKNCLPKDTSQMYFAIGKLILFQFVPKIVSSNGNQLASE